MHRVEVAFSNEGLDSIGYSTKNSVSEDLGIEGLEKIRYSEAYYIYTSLENGKLREIIEKVFVDPVLQSFSIDEDLIKDFDFKVEVKYHADVTDNLAIVAKEAMEDYLGVKVEGNVKTARRYYITGQITIEQAKRIAKEMLANEIIETYSVEAKK